MKKLVLKVCSIMFFVIWFTLLFSMNAMAYIDPSVMTYAIQAIAGIAIAIAAAIGMYWRSAKRKISKKLGVDENKNKEVEADEIVVKKQDKDENIV